MLNAAFGSLVLLAGAVALIIKGRDLAAFFNALVLGPVSGRELLAPVFSFALSMLSSFVIVTASSISIEGKSLWILRSMPLAAKDVIDAKRRMHLLLAGVPAFIAFAAGVIVLRFDVVEMLVTAAFVFLAIEFFTNLGMIFGLKIPVLDWDNEAVAVKTGAAVTLSTFLGFALTAVAGGLFVAGVVACILLKIRLIFALLAIDVLLAPAVFLIRAWIYKRGTAVFDAL